MNNYHHNIDISELETDLFNSKNKIVNWLNDELKLHPEETKNKIGEIVEKKGLFNVGIGYGK